MKKQQKLMNEYAICKERGHAIDYDADSNPLDDGDYSKDTCKFCRTVFWTEEILHERNVPKVEKIYEQ